MSRSRRRRRPAGCGRTPRPVRRRGSTARRATSSRGSPAEAAMELVAGGIAVALASFLGGVTGFGYSLVATPLLLLDGYSLRFVVTVNLALALVTRLSVAVRFRRSASPRRVAPLIVAAIPGLWLGVEVLGRVAPSDIKVAAGVVTMIAAALIARSGNA